MNNTAELPTFDLDQIREIPWVKRAAWYCYGYAKRHPDEPFENAWHAWIGYEIDSSTPESRKLTNG